ncbi:MAG: ABC transporter permease [Kiritimatiellae bacterium]|nr:ABC transporter permease [Kiritimatiellia bacterium]MDD5523008.1 ABC transporter permease [Kiritimatiellia bacterium]
MQHKKPLYGKSFDVFLAVPLVIYLLLIAGLTLAVFLAITPKSILQAFEDRAIWDSISLSLITTTISTFFSVCVAIPAGYILSRHRFPGHSIADTLVDLPIVLPPLVMGLCVLLFFNTSVGLWLDRGIVEEGLFIYQPLGIVLVQFIVGCAFAVRVIKSGFDSMDPNFEDMAMTLGANRWQTFYKVTLPNAAPSIMAGAVISWARIFGLFGPILLVAGTMRGRTEIMPTTIFLEVSIGRIEVALVIGALMILMSMAMLIVLKRLGGKGYLL